MVCEAKTVIMKGIRTDFSSSPYLRYRNNELVGKRYTLVAFGRCNYKCTFCFTAGDESDAKGVFPDAHTANLVDVKDFVAQEVRRGNPIRISGGEPALYVPATLELLALIRDLGGFSITDSNGSSFTALQRFAPLTDVLSVDPIKAEERRVVELTGGMPKHICWDRALETTRRLGELPCDTIEFKTMLFEPINPGHLEFVYGLLPKRPEHPLLWTLKTYLPTKSYFPQDPKEDIRRVLFSNGLNSPSKEAAIRAGEELVRSHPDLEGRLTVIFGSTRDPKNYQLF